MIERKRFLNQRLNLDIYGNVKVQDIEFETGFGPLFLMNDESGSKFWLTRKELVECEIAGPCENFGVYDKEKVVT